MMNKIQITGSEDNKANAMGSLMNQSTVVHCLPDEMYVVSDEVLNNLEKDKIKFKVLESGNSIVHVSQEEVIEKSTKKMENLRDKAEKELRRIRP